ncbi:MAG TPA: formyltransferase family protein [Ktedonobacterales bacterium]
MSSDSHERAHRSHESAPPLSVVVFGMSGVFTARPLAALLEAGIAVRAFVLPALAADGSAHSALPPIRALPAQTTPGRPLPLLDPASSSPRQMAAARGVPVFEAADLAAPDTLAMLAALAPSGLDAICVACFPRRLPPALLRLPRLGALNVHPSLLPANRGPDPLFWTFYHGDEQTGVTVHLMDETLDTGPILAQESIPVPEGISEARLERTCAEVGGRLLVASLRALADGSARPQPQDESRATHFGFSLPERDYALSPSWPASRAYRFVQGIAGRGVPITVEADGRLFQVLGALGYDAHERMAEPLRLEGDVLALRCAPGVLYARVVERGGGGDGEAGAVEGAGGGAGS